MNQLIEVLRSDGKIWVVVVVIGVVLFGWLYYLLRIGSRVSKIDKRLRG